MMSPRGSHSLDLPCGASRGPGIGGVVDLSDLVSEGSFGLLRACKTYDANLGAFSTWAMRLIDKICFKQFPQTDSSATGDPRVPFP